MHIKNSAAGDTPVTECGGVWRSMAECGGVRRSAAECDECGGVWRSVATVAQCGAVWRSAVEYSRQPHPFMATIHSCSPTLWFG